MRRQQLILQQNTLVFPLNGSFMGHGSCWIKVHDGALCKAWLAASEDSINGTNWPKAKSFWSSVFEVRVNLLCNEAPNGKNSAMDQTQSCKILCSPGAFCSDH